MCSLLRRAARAMLAVAAGMVALLLVAAPAASAHGDTQLVDGTVVIPAGEAVAFPGEVHYHRLMVRITADGPVTVRLGTASTGVVVLERGPAAEITVNELIRCCDDRTWELYHLEIANETDHQVSARARAQFAHDDVGVLVYQAEGGIAQGVVVLTAVLSVALLVAARRQKAVRLRTAGVVFIVVVAFVLATLAYGTLRYGGAGTGGIQGAGYDMFPLPNNRYVGVSSLPAFLALLGWMWAAASWARARPLAKRSTWLAFGCVLIGAAALTTALVAATYQVLFEPAVFATALSLPILSVMVWGGWTKPRATKLRATSPTGDIRP